MFFIVSILYGFVVSVSTAGSNVALPHEASYSTCPKESFFDLIQTIQVQRGQPRVSEKSLFSTLDDWWLPGEQILIKTFPIDTEERNFVRIVKNALFSKTNVTPFIGTTTLVAWSENALASVLDLDPAVTRLSKFLDIFSGKEPLRNTIPLTHRYGGHQFGIWADQLGDGRAHLIGEYTNRAGQRYELNLKGSGKTPYSRKGDGRAIVRSSVREFLASEATHHLGIPTSRSVTLITSSDTVKRDLVYNGKISDEKTAMVLRVAPSWFRFGTVEILAKYGELELLQTLLDFVIKHYFQEISISSASRYLQLFSTIVEETANMIALWQAFGFVHGVGNTDNFSLLSITIDYGPFQFLDKYDPDLVSNLSDDEARYSYNKQPEVGRYNLEKLAESLKTVIPRADHHVLSLILDGYSDLYRHAFVNAFRKKIGLVEGQEAEDEDLIASLLRIMKQANADFTLTFRQLADASTCDLELCRFHTKLWALEKLCEHSEFKSWAALYEERLVRHHVTDKARRAMMFSVNPKYVLRNWIAEEAIDAVNSGNFSIVQNLVRILETPFEDQKEGDELGYAEPPPWWASTIKISCAS